MINSHYCVLKGKTAKTVIESFKTDTILE